MSNQNYSMNTSLILFSGAQMWLYIVLLLQPIKQRDGRV